MPDVHGFLTTAAPPPAERATLLLGAGRTVRLPRPTEAGPIDVSVCIANWNCRDLLRACLESLLDRPQGVRLEVIVIDNASADGTPDLVAREFPDVILHCNPANFGFARANNQAAARARGRYLFFLNNDTVVPPGALRQLLDYAESHPDVGLIGPRLCEPNGRPQVSYRRRPTMGTLLHRTFLFRWTGLLRHAYRRYRGRDVDPDAVRPVDVLMGAAMLLRRDVFFACGPWDEHFQFGGEDLDLSFQVNQRYPVIYHPGVVITHYGRMSTRQHIGYASSQMAAGMVRYLRKTGSSWPALLAYKIIISLDAPVQLLGKGLQSWWRHLQGRPDKAEKSWLAFRALGYFLTRGLGPFWRA